MMSIKQSLTLLGILTISTPIVDCTSTITAGDSKLKDNVTAHVAAGFDRRVKQDLGLLNDKGKGTQNLLIDSVHSYWELPITRNPITAAALLKEDKTAKSKNSYDFIRETLGVNPESETVWTKAKFKEADLSAFKGVVTDLKPFLAPTKAKDDYAAVNGYYKFQFKKDDKLIDEKYLMPLQIAPEVGLFGASFVNVAKALKLKDTEIVKKFDFKVGGTAPSLDEIRKGMGVTLHSSDWAVAESIRLSVILNNSVGEWPAFTTKDAVIDKSGKWAKGNTLTLYFRTKTVTFAAIKTFKL